MNIVTEQRKQASVIAARDELVSLPLYASQRYGDAGVLARALELTKVWLPAEVQGAVDEILDAQLMTSVPGWCVSGKERAG